MPAVMMRSWASAISAPAAIFNSKRRVMYSVTSTRKITSAVIIFREMVLPHVAPTSCSLISFTEMPAVRASADRSWSPRNDDGALGEEDALGEAATEGEGLGEGDADAEGVGVGEAELEAVGVGVGVTVAEGDGLGVVGVRPSS